jgi:hypothetical protein
METKKAAEQLRIWIKYLVHKPGQKGLNLLQFYYWFWQPELLLQYTLSYVWVNFILYVKNVCFETLIITASMHI